MQTQKAEFEGACRTKDEQSVARETEIQKQAAEIILLRERTGHLETQLQETEVHIYRVWMGCWNCSFQ